MEFIQSTGTERDRSGQHTLLASLVSIVVMVNAVVELEPVEVLHGLADVVCVVLIVLRLFPPRRCLREAPVGALDIVCS